jgi:transposase InsO family protein
MKQPVKPYDGKCHVRFDAEGSGEIQTLTLLSHEFRSAMKLLGIKLEYIQKHTPEDNGNIESFHNSIKTDYIWPNEFRDFHDASIAIGKAFTDYNECGPHSFIDYPK